MFIVFFDPFMVHAVFFGILVGLQTMNMRFPSFAMWTRQSIIDWKISSRSQPKPALHPGERQILSGRYFFLFSCLDYLDWSIHRTWQRNVAVQCCSGRSTCRWGILAGFPSMPSSSMWPCLLSPLKKRSSWLGSARTGKIPLFDNK